MLTPTIPSKQDFMDLVVLEGDLMERHGSVASLIDLETEEEVWHQAVDLFEEAA